MNSYKIIDILNSMKRYTAKDGIKILKLLGLYKNLDKEEIKEFSKNWDIYFSQTKEPLTTTINLYAFGLPLILKMEEVKPRERVNDFLDKMIEKNFLIMYDEGFSLEHILEDYDKANEVKNERTYLARDGIKFLKYLGYSELSDKEEIFFTNHWYDYLRTAKNDPISAARRLYCIRLPLQVRDESNPIEKEEIRDILRDFEKRMKEKRVEEMIAKGLHLDDILEFFG